MSNQKAATLENRKVLVANTLHDQVETEGFAICEEVLSAQVVSDLINALERASAANSVLKRGGIFAIRNLLEVSPEVRDLAESKPLRALVDAVLGQGAFPVRGILFDKIPGANWKVPWHQDVTIAVESRVDAAGYGPWSIKANVHHVQPPASVLQHMISIRLHLDRCDADNGALHLIPGTHCIGRIPEENIASICAESAEHVCAVGLGGALLMSPLILHTSSPSRTPGHRRVIHIDYAAIQLPHGMKWLGQTT